MVKLAESLGAIIVAIFIIFLVVIAGTLVGAIAGWTVGLFFGDIVLKTLACFGASGFTMLELGATLGFVGGFFSNRMGKE